MRRGFYIQSPDTLTFRWRIGGVFIVIVSLLITGFLWWLLTSTNNQVAQSRLQSQVGEMVKVLEKDMEINADILYASRSLFFVNPALSSDEWDAFVLTQNVFDRYYGIKDISYAKKNNDQATITYVSTPETASMVGNNANDKQAYKDVLSMAEKTGTPSASSVYTSGVTGREGTKDFLVALATYDTIPPANISDDTRSTLTKGYVLAEVSVDELLSSTLDVISIPNTVSISLTDKEGAVFYKNGPATQPESHLTQSRQLNVGGQVWTMTFDAPLHYQLTLREKSAPAVFIIGGILFTILIISLYLERAGVQLHFIRRKTIQ